VEVDIRGTEVSFKVKESSKASKARINYRKGKITVVVPENSAVSARKVLKSNGEWVLDKWFEAQKFREKVPERVFEEGQSFKVLGENKEIVIESRKGNKVRDDIFLARHLVNRSSVKIQLEKVLRNFCREIIHQKMEKYKNQVDGQYNRVFIRDQSTRWGSCSNKGNLNFNWRLILGPEHVLEYVVVHELAHLDIPNHSEKYWSKVEKIMPDYRVSKMWLEENSAKLVYDSEFQ